MRGIGKRFGAVKALTDVDFWVNEGEVVALVGDNGAGKSTLVKVLSGVHPPDAGIIEFDGETVEIADPADAQELGIATVFQDLALCDNLDVVANLWLGQELLSSGRLDEVARIIGRAVGRRGLDDCGRRCRHRAAEPLQRELAVEQLGISRRLLEIADRLRGLAGRLGGAPRPVIALGRT
jgi:ABC-type sugar transport system ATPase subunit